jgi:hypothetical protein
VTVDPKPNPSQANSTQPSPPDELGGEARRRAYEPPAILWEQEFVALAQVSEVTCDPPIDPRCF